MKNLLKHLENIQKIIETLFKRICIVFGFLLLLLLTANVVVRIFPIMSLHWFDEIVEILFAWLVFLGSAYLFSKKDHFAIEWIQKKMETTKFLPFYKLIINIISLIFVSIFMYQSMRLTILANDWTPIFNFSKRFLYVSMPIAGVFMIYVSLLEIIKTPSYFKHQPKEDNNFK